MNPDETKSLVTKVLLILFSSLSTALHLSPDASTLGTASSDVADLIVLGYGIYDHWNMRKVPEAAKVVGGAILLALFLGLASPPVSAANLAPPMPAKANPFTGYVAGRCGAYAGINTMGAAGAVNGGPPGASIIQGDIGVTVGYGCPIGQTPGSFWFVEGNFDFANVNGASSGLALTGPAHFEQRAALGSPISTMLSVLPSNPFGGVAVPSLPVLPAGVTAGASYPFMFVSLHEQDVSAQFGLAQNRQWLLSPGLGIGLETRLSNGVVIDTTAQWKLDSNGLSIGPRNVSLGNAAVVGLTLKY